MEGSPSLLLSPVILFLTTTNEEMCRLSGEISLLGGSVQRGKFCCELSEDKGRTGMCVPPLKRLSGRKVPGSISLKSPGKSWRLMDLSKKLQIPAGTSVLLANSPPGFNLGGHVSKKGSGAAVLVFAANSEQLVTNGKPAIDAAKEDRISWIAYPKAGQMGTDLNRDKLFELMRPYGIEGVRLVSIDEVWSAMRFRPGRRR